MKYLLLFMLLLPSLTFAQKNKTYVRVVSCAATAPNMRMTVQPQQVVKAGTPQDFYMWAQISQKITTAVSKVNINKDSNPVLVYTLEGRVLETAPSEDALKRLPKGVYIVRGKKFVVR